MFLFANILEAVAYVLGAAIDIYFWVVLAACFISFVNCDPMNPIVRTLRTITEPVFYRVRKLLPFTMNGGFDFSPIVVLLGLKVLDIILVKSLLQLSARM